MDPNMNEMSHLAQFMDTRERAGEKKLAQARERRHSMLSVLMDEELVMMHSVAKSETIPQTRERAVDELIGSGAAAEYDADADPDGIAGGSEEGEDYAGRSSSSSGSSGRGRQRQYEKPGKTTAKSSQAQSQFRFGDQVVVNVVERGGKAGWIVDGGRGSSADAMQAATATAKRERKREGVLPAGSSRSVSAGSGI